MTRAHIAFVPHATILVAWHQVIARLVKARAHFGDESRHYHAVDVSSGDEESVHARRTRHAECDLGIGGNDDALRHKRILLREDAYDPRSIRLNRRTEIGLDELACKMEAGRINCFYVRRGVCGPMHAADR